MQIINLESYMKETKRLLHIMNVKYNSINVELHSSIKDLMLSKAEFEQLQNVRKSFKKTLGYQVAKTDNYIFFIKKTIKGIIYIEIETFPKNLIYHILSTESI